MKRTLSAAVVFALGILALGCATQRGPGGQTTERRTDSVAADSPISTSAIPSTGATSETHRTGLIAGLGPYLSARARDFLDIPKCAAGTGLGLHVDVEATMLFHFGLGGGFNQLVGLTHGLWWGLEVVGGFPITNWAYGEGGWRGMTVCHYRCPFYFPLLLHSLSYPVLPDFASSLVPIFMTYKNGKFGPPSVYETFHPIRWADVEAGVTLGVVAFRAGVSPGEALDFALGWFGIDLGEDDQNAWDRKGWAAWMERESERRSKAAAEKAASEDAAQE